MCPRIMYQALWDSGCGTVLEDGFSLPIMAVDCFNIFDAVIDGDRLAISLPSQHTFACAELYALAPTTMLTAHRSAAHSIPDDQR